MPVDTRHPDYLENASKWEKYRNISEGQDAVKKAGEAYLPRLGGQSDSDYESYKERALFFNATGRTIEGMVGVAFRKLPSIEFPESRKDFLLKVGKEREAFLPFAKRVFNNIITVGRHGVLLDTEDGEANQYPYMVDYTAESILNWKTDVVNGENQLTRVVLQEGSYEENSTDRFDHTFKERIRVLELITLEEMYETTRILLESKEVDESTIIESLEKLKLDFLDLRSKSDKKDLYVFKTEVWEKVNIRDKEEYILKEVIFPKIRGRFLDYIPFVFFGAMSTSSMIQKSPINDLCDVNISHYHSSADIEHGRHYTALPTAWFAGFKTEKTIYIGSQTAIVTEDPAATAGFLEYTGQGLKAIETAMESKEKSMAVLGARLLETQKQAVESYDTQRHRIAGEISILSSVVYVAEEGFQLLLNWAANWMGIIKPSAISVSFNKDYTAKVMDPGLLQALTQALQSGKISLDTYFYNLERGELLPDGRTLEEEINLIEKYSSVSSAVSPMNLDEEEEEEDDDEDDEEEEEGYEEEEK